MIPTVNIFDRWYKADCRRTGAILNNNRAHALRVLALDLLPRTFLSGVRGNAEIMGGGPTFPRLARCVNRGDRATVIGSLRSKLEHKLTVVTFVGAGAH
jgi:hypothetical protein